MRNETKLIINTVDGPQMICDAETAVATMAMLEPGEVWLTPYSSWEKDQKRKELHAQAERIRREQEERPE